MRLLFFLGKDSFIMPPKEAQRGSTAHVTTSPLREAGNGKARYFVFSGDHWGSLYHKSHCISFVPYESSLQKGQNDRHSRQRVGSDSSTFISTSSYPYSYCKHSLSKTCNVVQAKGSCSLAAAASIRTERCYDMTAKTTLSSHTCILCFPNNSAKMSPRIKDNKAAQLFKPPLRRGPCQPMN